MENDEIWWEYIKHVLEFVYSRNVRVGLPKDQPKGPLGGPLHCDQKLSWALAIDDLQAMRRTPTDWALISTAYVHLFNFVKGSIGKSLTRTTDVQHGGGEAWPSTDLRPVGRGIVGQLTILLPRLR